MKKSILLVLFILVVGAVMNLEAGLYNADFVTDAPVYLVDSQNPAISSHTATLYITTTSYQRGDFVELINPNTNYHMLVSTASSFNKVIGMVLKNQDPYTWRLDHGFMYLKYDVGASTTTIYGGHFRP